MIHFKITEKNKELEKKRMIQYVILQSTSYIGAEIDIEDWEYTELRFNENLAEQVSVIRQLADDLKMNIYFNLPAIYADNIQDLSMPQCYNGRIIFPRKLGGIILEFNQLKSDWIREETDFLLNLFFCTTVYLIDATSQEVQDIYLSDSIEEKKAFSAKIMCVIDVDNDGSQMKILYRKNLDMGIYQTN